jgi:hypothetical protein
MEPFGCHRKMIRSTRELWSFMQKGRFFQLRNESQKEPEIRSLLNDGFGKAGVKGRDKRKERALDTVLPKQKLPYAFLAAGGAKNVP